MKTKITAILLTSALGVTVYAVDSAIGAKANVATVAQNSQNDYPTSINGTSTASSSTEYRSPTNAAGATTEDTQAAVSRQTSSDVKLTTRVQKELKSKAPNLNTDQYVIYSQNGEVTLQGSVDTKADSDRVEKLVRRVHGVKHVDNRLVVGSATDSSYPGTTK